MRIGLLFQGSQFFETSEVANLDLGSACCCGVSFEKLEQGLFGVRNAPWAPAYHAFRSDTTNKDRRFQFLAFPLPREG